MNNNSNNQADEITLDLSLRETKIFDQVASLGYPLVSGSSRIATLKHQELIGVLAFLCEYYQPGIKGTTYSQITFSKAHRNELKSRLSYLGLANLYPETATDFKQPSTMLSLMEALLSMIDRSKGVSFGSQVSEEKSLVPGTPRSRAMFSAQTASWKNKVANRDTPIKITPRKATPRKSTPKRSSSRTKGETPVKTATPVGVRSSPRIRHLRSPKVHAADSPVIKPVNPSKEQKKKSGFEKISNPFASRSLIPRSPSSGADPINRRSSLVESRAMDEVSTDLSLDEDVSSVAEESKEEKKAFVSLPQILVEAQEESGGQDSSSMDMDEEEESQSSSKQQQVSNPLNRPMDNESVQEAATPFIPEPQFLSEVEGDMSLEGPENTDSIPNMLAQVFDHEGGLSAVLDGKTGEISSKFNFEPVKVSQLRRSEVETILNRVQGFIKIWKNNSDYDERFEYMAQ